MLDHFSSLEHINSRSDSLLAAGSLLENLCLCYDFTQHRLPYDLMMSNSYLMLTQPVFTDYFGKLDGKTENKIY